MNATEATTGLVLPFASLGLIGAGPEGQHALEQFGIRSADLGGDLQALRERLAGDQEAVPLSRFVDALVAEASHAAGWLSIRPRDSAKPPLIVLMLPDSTLGVCLHGDVVEWVYGGIERGSQLIRAARDAAVSSEVVLTAFVNGDAVAGVRFLEGEAQVAAKEESVLQQLTDACAGGTDGIWSALRSLSGLSPE